MGVAGSSHSKRPTKRGGGSARPPRKPTSSNGARTPGGRKPLIFTIPSEVAAGRNVHKTIMDRVEAQRYDEESIFAIRLALEEGLMNAIKHGNKHDRSKTVHVEAKVTPKATEIIIEDQGKGFERSCVPDPTADENLVKCSGRGLLLIEAYMDKVRYTKGGRCVKMIKNKA